MHRWIETAPLELAKEAVTELKRRSVVHADPFTDLSTLLPSELHAIPFLPTDFMMQSIRPRSTQMDVPESKVPCS